MKKKFFMRGLGTGVIFATIIMLAAYMTSGGWQKKMSDEEIMKKAEKLGMVTTQDLLAQVDAVDDTEYIEATESIVGATTEAKKKTEETTEATTEKITTEVTTEATTEAATEVTTEATTEATTEEKTTEATTEKSKEETTEKPGSKTKVKITVKGGMGSEDIAKLLADAGLVKSASDFDSFLCKNGYDSKLEVGTFELDSTMSYDEMAKELCKKK